MEPFLFRDQRLHRLFLINPSDTAAVRLWTVNVEPRLWLNSVLEGVLDAVLLALVLA